MNSNIKSVEIMWFNMYQSPDDPKHLTAERPENLIHPTEYNLVVRGHELPDCDTEKDTWEPLLEVDRPANADNKKFMEELMTGLEYVLEQFLPGQVHTHCS